MKTSSSRLSTSPSRPTRRGFQRRLASLLAMLAASGFVFASIRWAGSFLPSTQPNTPNTQSRDSKAHDSQSNTRVGANAASSVPAWRVWWNAWLASRGAAPTSDAQNTTPAPPKPLRKVWIDTEALARRHPAWQLANQLAARNVSPIPLSSPPVSASRPLASELSDDTASFWKSFSGSQIPGASVGEKRERDNGFTNAMIALNSTSSTRYNSRLSRESVLSKAARANQEKALRVLANDLNRDLRRERTLRERESREVLGEAIDAARTLDLTSPDPILLSAEEQLELTNLRLKLLPSSQISPEEEAVARRRYRVLQGRWDEALRRQEAQYRDEIEEQREVEPRRLRREGEAAIAQSQSRLQIADTARLRTLSQSQRELLARDFTMWQPLRNSSNRLSLSPIATSSGNFAVDNSAVAKRLLRTNRAPRVEISPRSFPRDISFSNNAQMPSRVLDVSKYDAVSNTVNVANSVAELRAQARRDAQIWAQIVAQREGWQRSSPDKNAKTPLFNATEIVWRAWQR